MTLSIHERGDANQELTRAELPQAVLAVLSHEGSA
ncbi:hypothetical protein M2428_002742 [Arthrobacter sp. ES3-54]|nr:hypothetical protein [Arthrobacter sp. ES3-54]